MTEVIEITQQYFEANRVESWSYRDGSHYLTVNGDFISDELESKIYDILHKDNYRYDTYKNGDIVVRTDEEAIAYLRRMKAIAEESITRNKERLVEYQKLIEQLKDCK